MTRDEIMNALQAKRMTEVIELVEDAETGELEELELVEHLGLIADEALNHAVLAYLMSKGVKITYLSPEDFDDEEEDGDED
ncbi:hypothetical protein EDM56_06315 [Brevibacillus fluminis]|uniref:Uncharacterized protein n=1 Tax=Brevibacillus fluminis TaxID=511487 RepID=A0A3M8DTE3_9BACL|nr:hypothetical protein [Brevibacillus fluminis]RNB91194.1 hypothetical protein EDM56_06315 [Brevibacillus fluminis]